MGLRYVNRVELAAESVNFDDYLTVSLSFPPGFPTAISGFLDRVEMVYEGEPIMLAFTWASTDAPPGTMAFILDLDLYATCDPPVGVERAFEILNDLKVKEGPAFEALLKDRLREEFGEIS